MCSSTSKSTDRTGKVFLVLSNTECQCLVCDGVYTRDAAGARVHACAVLPEKAILRGKEPRYIAENVNCLIEPEMWDWQEYTTALGKRPLR